MSRRKSTATKFSVKPPSFKTSLGNKTLISVHQPSVRQVSSAISVKRGLSSFEVSFRGWSIMASNVFNLIPKPAEWHFVIRPHPYDQSRYYLLLIKTDVTWPNLCPMGCENGLRSMKRGQYQAWGLDSYGERFSFRYERSVALYALLQRWSC